MSLYEKKHPDKCIQVNGKTYCCDTLGTPLIENEKALCRFEKDNLTLSAIPSNPLWLSLLVIFAYIGVLVVNALASLLPLNGQTTGEVSDAYPNLFAPAGLTFSIWGVIYVLLGIYVGFQLLTAKSLDSAEYPYTNIVFIISCVFNMAWIFAWHYEQFLISVLLMIGLFISLTLIYLSFHTEYRGLYTQSKPLLVTIPFSVYYGWISVATVANITTYLVSTGWTGGSIGETTWTVIMLVVITFIGIFMISLKGDIFYVAVLIWAVIGILIKRIEDVMNPQPTIVTVAIIGLVFLGFEVIFGSYRRWKKLQFLCSTS